MKNCSTHLLRCVILFFVLNFHAITTTAQLYVFSHGSLGQSLKSETSNFDLIYHQDALIGAELNPVLGFYMTASLGYTKIMEDQKYIRPLDYHYSQGGIGYKFGCNRKWIACEVVYGQGMMKLPIDYANLPAELATRYLRNSSWQQRMLTAGIVYYPFNWLDVALRYRRYFGEMKWEGVGQQAAISIGVGLRLNIPKTIWPDEPAYSKY